ncbi:glycosyltransferase [Anoxybacillus kestanbolensis]|uniref:glycosyltransferase n=1 Tax=Anoxybacillus kestanbolensis TaxID=227476 RepID=UPI003D1C5E7B
MNILYVNNDMSVSGSPKAIVTEVTELKKKGHNVVVVSRDGELAKNLIQNSITYYPVDLPVIGLPIIKNSDRFEIGEYLRFLKGFFWKNRLWRSYLKLKEIIKKEQIEIIQSHQPGPTLVSYLVAKKLNIPLIIRVQHILRNEFPPLFYKQIVEYASGISVITSEIKRHLTNVYNINEKDITIIPTLVKFHDEQEEHVTELVPNFIRNGKLKILTVTTLGSAKYKSVIELIKGIDLLLCENYDCELTIVGDGPYREEIEKQIQKTKDSKKFILAGKQENVERFYQETDVVVGVGRVAMEALYYGKPLLCCSHFSYAGIFKPETADEISTYNFSGRNFPGDSLNSVNIYKDLKEIISYSLNDYQKMCHYNKRYFKQKFDADKIISKTENLFKNALNSKGKKG